jgi:hypothetical protein
MKIFFSKRLGRDPIFFVQDFSQGRCAPHLMALPRLLDRAAMMAHHFS